MTEAEHHQQELEHQQQALEMLAEKVRHGVRSLPFNQKVGLVGELEGNSFEIVDFGLRKYKVTIQEQ